MSEAQFLDREYNPRTTIPDFAASFARWQNAAREARASLPGQLDLRYGPAPAERLDFFPAPGRNAPLLVFIHGGYWRALDKDDFSWVAPAYVAAGISVAVLNYGLAPATPIPLIVEQMRRAMVWLHRRANQLHIDPQRVVCSGHSAGAHLTAMMLATDWTGHGEYLPPRLLRGAVTVSGLFDLEPLTRAEFLRADLALDMRACRAMSPAFLPLPHPAPLVRAVGALESAEFHRQAELIAQAWPAACPTDLIDVPDCHHLAVCEAFAAKGSQLFAATRALCDSP